MPDRIGSRMSDPNYRRALAESQTSAHRAAQITTMREDRGWTQTDLAKRAGMAQARISLLEDPNYESVNISTLQRIAGAFGVVLLVQYVTFQDYLTWSRALSERDLHVDDYDKQKGTAVAQPPQVLMVSDAAEGSTC